MTILIATKGRQATAANWCFLLSWVSLAHKTELTSLASGIAGTIHDLNCCIVGFSIHFIEMFWCCCKDFINRRLLNASALLGNIYPASTIAKDFLWSKLYKRETMWSKVHNWTWVSRIISSNTAEVTNSHPLLNAPSGFVEGRLLLGLWDGFISALAKTTSRQQLQERASVLCDHLRRSKVCTTWRRSSNTMVSHSAHRAKAHHLDMRAGGARPPLFFTPRFCSRLARHAAPVASASAQRSCSRACHTSPIQRRAFGYECVLCIPVLAACFQHWN